MSGNWHTPETKRKPVLIRRGAPLQSFGRTGAVVIPVVLAIVVIVALAVTNTGLLAQPAPSNPNPISSSNISSQPTVQPTPQPTTMPTAKQPEFSFGETSFSQTDFAALAAAKVQAKIVEIPTLFGDLEIPLMENEIETHGRAFMDAYFNSQDKASKQQAWDQEAAWLKQAMAEGYRTEAPALAKEVVDSTLMAIDASARTDLGASGLNWVGNAVAALRSFGDYVIEPVGITALELAEKLQADAEAAVLKDIEGGSIDTADTAPVVPEIPPSAPVAGVQQNPQVQISIVQTGENAASDPGTSAFTNPTTEPQPGLEDPASPNFPKDSYPEREYEPSEGTSPPAEDGTFPAVLEGKTFGINWGPANFYLIARWLYQAHQSGLGMSELPLSTKLWVLDNSPCEFSPLTVLKGEWEVYCVVVGETQSTLWNQGGTTLSLSNWYVGGKDPNGNKWYSFISIWRSGPPFKVGDEVTTQNMIQKIMSLTKHVKK